MKTQTKIAIATLIAALGDTFKAIAAELNGDAPQGATSEPAAAEPPKTRKPREPKAAPTETTEAPAEASAEPETPAPATSTATVASNGTGKSYDELRALIEPLVKGGQGAAVKAVIAKYSATGLKDMEAKHHAAFEKDIESLTY